MPELVGLVEVDVTTLPVAGTLGWKCKGTLLYCDYSLTVTWARIAIAHLGKFHFAGNSGWGKKEKKKNLIAAINTFLIWLSHLPRGKIGR